MVVHPADIGVNTEKKQVTICFPNEKSKTLCVSKNLSNLFVNDFGGTFNITRSGISYDSVDFLERLNKEVEKNNEKQGLEENMKAGIYLIPPPVKPFLSDQKFISSKVYSIFKTADYLEREDLSTLVLCQYTEQIVTNSPFDIKKDCDIFNEFNNEIARILVHQVLMKQYDKRDCISLKIGSSDEIASENNFSLSPTAGRQSFTVTERDPISGYLCNTYLVQKYKACLKTSFIGSALFFADEEEDDYLGPEIFTLCIFDPNTSNRKYCFQNGGWTYWVIDDWKNELNAISAEELKKSKIIIKPRWIEKLVHGGRYIDACEGFYLKIGDKIWLCNIKMNENYDPNTDQNTHLQKKLIDPEKDINNPWIERYLSLDSEQLGPCWGMIPCKNKNKFFNNSFLNMYRQSKEYRATMENNFCNMVGQKGWFIEQQIYNNNLSKEYCLWKQSTPGFPHKYRFTESFFDHDIKNKTKRVLHEMNRLYDQQNTAGNGNTLLMAAALAFAQASKSNFTLGTEGALRTQVGELYDHVPDEIKKIILPQSKTDYSKWFWRTYIKPHEREIQYGIRALALTGIIWVGYKIFSKIQNIIASLVSGGIKKVQASGNLFRVA